jgi:hypothetical protein
MVYHELTNLSSVYHDVVAKRMSGDAERVQLAADGLFCAVGLILGFGESGHWTLLCRVAKHGHLADEFGRTLNSVNDAALQSEIANIAETLLEI